MGIYRHSLFLNSRVFKFRLVSFKEMVVYRPCESLFVVAYFATFGVFVIYSFFTSFVVCCLARPPATPAIHADAVKSTPASLDQEIVRRIRFVF
jgi:hypothetical protein